MDSAVIEPPKNHFTLFKPGSEQVKQISKAGWIASKAARAARKEAKLKPASELNPSFEQLQLKTTRARIEAEYAALEAEPDPDLRFKLGCLLKKLWEIYQLLAQVPGPGTRKPAPERKASQSVQAVDPSAM